ncbi:hypothetical protein [Ectothiorhodospira marina]|uniref:Uncharacterized protein n=1 Tax=Ectothiorhodospira marina TaxID=1396821 RepID=A0A1H7RST0_9GAMM|nr:hypothetical protein [Ectothiorhodospira marina]SEL63253.1 hypothetical protein SAMN05444515_1276 [Ectothiorhodospira marina]
MITSKRNVSAYDGLPLDGGNRKIPNGPLFEPERVLRLVRDEALTVWARGAIEDAAKWEMDIPALCQLVGKAVMQGRYIGSEWCVQKPNGPWAASDAYKVTISEWNPCARRELDVTWYVKFSIAQTGSVLLSVSNHPEGC